MTVALQRGHFKVYNDVLYETHDLNGRHQFDRKVLTRLYYKGIDVNTLFSYTALKPSQIIDKMNEKMPEF